MNLLIIFLLLPISIFSQSFQANTFEYWEMDSLNRLTHLETQDEPITYTLLDDKLIESFNSIPMQSTYILQQYEDTYEYKRYYALKDDDTHYIITLYKDSSEIIFCYKKDGKVLIWRYYKKGEIGDVINYTNKFA